MLESVRLDSYLWAIRMYKSRSAASDAIKNNKVKLNEVILKASHLVKVGNTYRISYPQGVIKIIEVKALLDKRQSYELAKQHYIDKSPPSEKTECFDSAFITPNLNRERGAGRPTKKDKRDMTNFGWE